MHSILIISRIKRSHKENEKMKEILLTEKEMVFYVLLYFYVLSFVLYSISIKMKTLIKQ